MNTCPTSGPRSRGPCGCRRPPTASPPRQTPPRTRSKRDGQRRAPCRPPMGLQHALQRRLRVGGGCRRRRWPRCRGSPRPAPPRRAAWIRAATDSAMSSITCRPSACGTPMTERARCPPATSRNTPPAAPASGALSLEADDAGRNPASARDSRARARWRRNGVAFAHEARGECRIVARRTAIDLGDARVDATDRARAAPASISRSAGSGVRRPTGTAAGSMPPGPRMRAM